MRKFFLIAKKILFPITRSITGEGLKKTLKIIQKEFPKIKIKKIQSGTRVFDWKVPEEWNIKDAYVLDKYKKKIINFKKNNLHIIGYSEAVNKTISYDELKKNYFISRINLMQSHI